MRDSGRFVCDVFDTLTGLSLGSCLQTSFEALAAAADMHSDSFAVASTDIVVGNALKTTRPRSLRGHSKPVSGLSFVPRQRVASHQTSKKFEESSLLVSVSVDRSFLVWDPETEALLVRKVFETPLCAIATSSKSLLTVSGFLSTKSVALDLVRVPRVSSPDGAALRQSPLVGSVNVSKNELRRNQSSYSAES